VPPELPDLDDRTFEQIRDELLLRIPRYTPEWTDWNKSDPGVTLIDLFAWLAESIGYRMNKAPERCLLTFLDALGITPEPARPATTDLTFTVRQGETDPITVPARTPVASSVQTEDGPIIFETERGLELLPLRLLSVQVADVGNIELHTIEDGVPPSIRPFGANPQPGNALYLGFGPGDIPATFPQQLVFLIDPPASQETRPTDARLQWEYRASATTGHWSPLDTYVDGSRAFTRRGYVQIAGPRNSVAVAGVGKEPRPLHWLRCRLAGGGYAAGHAPVIELFRYNTVEAVSLSSVTEELAGQSDGRTGQVVRLRHRSVLPGTVRVTTVPPPGEAVRDDEPWQVVRDLAESGPQDRHVVVDAAAGELRFGDGEHGQVPLAGFDIVVSYRHGGTVLANVAKEAVTGLQTAAPGIESVTNLLAATGGRDEETSESLRQHAASRLRSLERAVTAEDYRQLALGVGGVADAVAIERRHPDYPDADIPGCVTVAVLPDVDLGSGKQVKPYASPELLDAVSSVLAPRRTLGAELFVRSARFLAVAVSVVLDVDPYASFGEIRTGAAARLRSALSPLPAGGATATTSRFGRDFFPTTLFAELQAVSGVIAVPLLEVTVEGTGQPISKPVEVQADQLVVPGQVKVEVRPRRDQ
jgi:phage-related baseplate assembly protein